MRNAIFAVLCAATLLLSNGCKVGSEDVEYWKGTVKGPGKIVAVVLAEKYPMELRTQAALALVEIERDDVDGVAELQRSLQRLDAPTRTQIVDGITPGLVRLMQGAGAVPQQVAAGEHAPPTAQQIRAKDAAFLLIGQASPQTSATLTGAVVGWFVEDFNGRTLSGSYSAEQIVRGLGAPAAATLVNALSARMAREALVKIAELIGQFGDAPTKARAAQKLVEIEQEMESPAFLDWIKAQVRAQLTQGGGAAPPDARIAEVAALNREGYLSGTDTNPSCILLAMKYLADQAPVRARLLAIAQAPSRGDAKLEVRRTRALQAMEGNAIRENLEPLLAIALDANSPVPVRDYAFDRIGDVHSTDALPRLWPMLMTADQRLRWRLGELILQLGGPGSVTEFFTKLPSAATTEYAPEELAGYAARMAQMNPPPTDLVRQRFVSPRWFDRVIALRYFERKGTDAELPRMQALVGDAAATTGPGWPAGHTVGKVAEAAIAAAKERLQEGSAGAHAPGPGTH